MSSQEHAEEGEDESVKVFVRIRPLNKRELAEKQTIGWDFNETSMLEDTQNGQRVYAYDHCFGPNSTNQETYDIVGKPVVLKAMEGFNGTVFTYGQTGSGKTWTMRGCMSDPGMMILCIRDIMGWLTSHPQIKYELRISYLEVYNEEINDLLGEPGNLASKNLKIVSEDSVRGAVIGNLVEEVAQTPEDFMAILQRGESSRSYASTEMNNESSRSHTIYRVTILSHEIQEDGTIAGGGKVAYLNLVDLAGSERQKSTKAEGKTLKEGSNINKSLLALGACINKLGESCRKGRSGGKPVFIPYRDSKLTRILKQSLGGNTLTSMLCAATPAPMHREETVSTLKFGQLCKSIKNKVKSNDGAVDDKVMMKQLRFAINDLKAKLEMAQKGTIVTDPESALGQALKDKGEVEAHAMALEAQMKAAGMSVDGGAGPMADPEEVVQLKGKVAEQGELISVLQRQLEDFQDLEEAKTAFEEYQQHSAQELDEGIGKLEEEKQALQNERYKMLKDRSNIDEKESRIGQLITNVDEKESKLRQMMGTMKEQQDQWQRSITDLQRREDLVDDWQTNHQQREKRLQETDAMQERKFAELNKREADVSQEEQKLRVTQKELLEREQRLQVAQSRVANSEQAMAALEEKLNNYELLLKKKEAECDIRDRELISRRKELESWDVLLREKDRKISVEQRNLDEREASVRATEDKVRLRDVESERRLLELRQNESAVSEHASALSKLQAELTERDRLTQEQAKRCVEQRETLATKEGDLAGLERRLMKLQEKMSGIEQREEDLQMRVDHHKSLEDDFFNVKVAQITSRHGKELGQLELIVAQQLKIASEFQKQLDASRGELAQKCSQIEDFELAMEERNALIEQLREHLAGSDMGSANTGDTGLDSDLGGSDDEADDSSQAAQAQAQAVQAAQAQTQAQAQAQAQAQKAAFGHSKQTPQLGPMGASVDKYGIGMGPPSPKKPAASGQEFVLQIAATQRMLYHILEKHDALPDRSGGLGRRQQRNSPRKVYKQQQQQQQQQQMQLQMQQLQQMQMQMQAQGFGSPGSAPGVGFDTPAGMGMSMSGMFMGGASPISSPALGGSSAGAEGYSEGFVAISEGQEHGQGEGGQEQEEAQEQEQGQGQGAALGEGDTGLSLSSMDLGPASQSRGGDSEGGGISASPLEVPLSPRGSQASPVPPSPGSASSGAGEEKEGLNLGSTPLSRRGSVPAPMASPSREGYSPSFRSRTSPSPYSSPNPNMASLVSSGGSRHGIPVTTVNLGSQSGLRRSKYPGPTSPHQNRFEI